MSALELLNIRAGLLGQPSCWMTGRARRYVLLRDAYLARRRSLRSTTVIRPMAA
jgi:ABC-type transporter lipoprotein component MlaA